MDRETLFDVFKTAIENERSAYEFYQSAAASTSDPDVKSLFEEFAKMELVHEKRLKEKYKELRETTF